MLNINPFQRRLALRFLSLAIILSGLQNTAFAQTALIGNLIVSATNVVLSATADPQFARKGKGSYQLIDSTAHAWESGQLQLTSSGLRVGEKKEAQEYQLEQVQQVVFRTDTFAVVRAVRFPLAGKAKQPVPPITLLSKRVWRHAQVELFEFASASGTVPVLRFPDKQALALPLQQKNFQQVMLALVGDHPILAKQLNAKKLDVSHTRAILESYLFAKPGGFNTTAAFALIQPNATR